VSTTALGFVFLAPSFLAAYALADLGATWWRRHRYTPWRVRERERAWETRAKERARGKRCVKYRNLESSSQVRNSWTEIQ
jgi:hypothetical protein